MDPSRLDPSKKLRRYTCSERNSKRVLSRSQRGQVLVEVLVLFLILGGIVWAVHRHVLLIEQTLHQPAHGRRP